MPPAWLSIAIAYASSTTNSNQGREKGQVHVSGQAGIVPDTPTRRKRACLTAGLFASGMRDEGGGMRDGLSSTRCAGESTLTLPTFWAVQSP